MSEIRQSPPDEIDLVRLLQLIVDTRIWVVLGLVLLTAGFWTAQVLLNLAVPTVYSYSARIDLVFNGVETRQYPNGAPMDINDIISPVVLNRVYEQSNLADRIDRGDFVAAFAVSPYTPDRSLIIEKFAAQAKNLKQAEIEERQTNLRRELVQSSRSSVEITFSSIHGLSPRIIEKIMLDVPSEWSRHLIEDIGVIRYDQQMYSNAVINPVLLESVDYLIAFEMLLERIRLLRKNLAKLSGLPNGFVVRDDVTALTVPDLTQAVNDVEQYRIIPLMNPVRTLGIAKNRSVVQLFFENVLIELTRSRDIDIEKKRNVVDTYDNYLKYEQQTATIDTEGRGAVSSGLMIPQFGAEFLDRIVEMTNAGDDIDYRQELNSRQLLIANQIAEQNAEISRVKTILDVLSKSYASSSSVQLRERYASEVVVQLPAILEELNGYFAISTRIYSKLSQAQLGHGGKLFRLSDGQVERSQSNHILRWANIRLYLILAFLLVVVTVPTVMIRNAMKTGTGARAED